VSTLNVVLFYDDHAQGFIGVDRGVHTIMVAILCHLDILMTPKQGRYSVRETSDNHALQQRHP
jgi:hypothetical protein